MGSVEVECPDETEQSQDSRAPVDLRLGSA
jgi:hypothetical protein